MQTWQIVDPRNLPVIVEADEQVLLTSPRVLEATGRLANLMQAKLHTVIELLIVGTAFRQSEGNWAIYTPDGALLGKISNTLMESAHSALLQAGLSCTKMTNSQTGERNGITFGYGYSGFDLGAMSARRRQGFVDLT